MIVSFVCIYQNISHLHFVVIVLVQFCVILARFGMSYEEIKIIKFGYQFLLCIHTMYIYSWKKMIKAWPILLKQLLLCIHTMYIYSRQKMIKYWPILVKQFCFVLFCFNFNFFNFFLLAHGVQLDNGVHPPCKCANFQRWFLQTKCRVSLLDFYQTMVDWKVSFFIAQACWTFKYIWRMESSRNNKECALVGLERMTKATTLHIN